MNKTDLKLLIISVLLFVIIIFATIVAFINSLGSDTDLSSLDNEVVQQETADREDFKSGEAKIEGYETAYLEYIENNMSYFSRGIILCDLNEDEIPELFSLSDEENGALMLFHEYKDGAVITPKSNTIGTCISIDNLICLPTFYENPECFFGVYRNKLTNAKAIINSVEHASENDRLDIITYDGKTLSVRDEGVKSMVDNIRWPVSEKRDIVMSDYVHADEELYVSVAHDGEYSATDTCAALKTLINDFKTAKTSKIYDKASDGTFYCYISNVDLSKNEIAVIPAAEITYEEYIKAMNSDKTVTINGEEFRIQYDEVMHNEWGRAYLYRAPQFVYSFTVPDENYPSSVIEGYMGNNPIKIKISNDFEIRYGVFGFDEYGNILGYADIGMNKTYAATEYFSHYAQYNLGSYCRATIKNNQLIFLDVMFDD